jgi:aminoglycoside/choline kinase family phosphotransferase
MIDPKAHSDRGRAAAVFLASAGWGAARRAFLAGDASNRRYERLHKGSETAVFMDAPPQLGEDVAPFVEIAAHLRSLGLSAPKVCAQDHAQGFLLLEDLGDDLFARVLADDLAPEHTLYAAATDVLVHLAQTTPPPGLRPWGPTQMAQAAGLSVDWYHHAATGHTVSAAPLIKAVHSALVRLVPQPSVIVLRDFHAENLLWLPARAGLARVGLLDFQLAQLGPTGYDLVSMLQDARRDVSACVAQAMRAQFAVAMDIPQTEFEATYAALGAQRALRILGTFARLCLRDGKPGYLRLIPRVWDQLHDNLRHRALAELRTLITGLLPAPTPAVLTRIEALCAPAPTPR